MARIPPGQHKAWREAQKAARVERAAVRDEAIERMIAATPELDARAKAADAVLKKRDFIEPVPKPTARG